MSPSGFDILSPGKLSVKMENLPKRYRAAKPYASPMARQATPGFVEKGRTGGEIFSSKGTVLGAIFNVFAGVHIIKK